MTPQIPARTRFVDLMKWAIANEAAIHYEQRRPIPNLPRRTLPLRTDCSGLVTILARWAGLHDPNERHFNGTGNSSSMFAACEHIAPEKAKRGDLITFGPNGDHHVVAIMQAGADPLVMSHGSERGPLALHLSEEARFQPRPVTFLRFIKAA